MDQTLLDKMTQKFQNMASVHLYSIDVEGRVHQWWTIDPKECLMPELVLVEANLSEQVQTISANITYWQRYVAQAKRVWEVREREYRVWRDGKMLELAVPEPGSTKVPAKDLREAKMRQDPEYLAYYNRTEEAEETYNTLVGMVDGLKAKREMMNLVVRRHVTDGAPYLSV